MNLFAALTAFFLSGFLCQPASAAENDPVLWVLEGQALGGYSEISDRDGVGSVISDWLVSPTVKVNEDLYWINIYNGAYNRSAQVVAEEEGGRQSESTMNHSLSTAFKYEVNETWSLRPLLFADWIFVNETEDEDFGDGLYDYRDLGAGIESSWTTLETEERRDTLRLGFRYLNREYPNYQALIASIAANPIEVQEKDLDGYKFNLSGESRSKDDWSWGLEGILFLKDYTDKKTINTNGILNPNETREDIVGYVNSYVSHPIRDGWTFRVDGQFGNNDSNLDFMDTHGTQLFLGDDDFIEDYFDWYSLSFSPALLYTRAVDQDRTMSGSLSYSYYLLHYTGRRFQNAGGQYQGDDQEDDAHTFSGKISYPLTKNVSWVGLLSYTTADSNQEFERFYLYSYDRWVAVTGISLKF